MFRVQIKFSSFPTISIAVQILLKALANLPRTDFVVLKSVLPLNLVSFSVASQVPSPREDGPVGFGSFIASEFINLCLLLPTHKLVALQHPCFGWLCCHSYQVCTILFNCLKTSSEILFDRLFTNTTAV